MQRLAVTVPTVPRAVTVHLVVLEVEGEVLVEAQVLFFIKVL